MAAKTRTAKPRPKATGPASAPIDQPMAVQPADALTHDLAVHEALAAVAAARAAAERAVAAAHEAAERAVAAAVAGGNRPRQD